MLWLHAMIHAGEDEGAEGDALRVKMDTPGERLSSAEVAAVKGIAADFHTLSAGPRAPILVDTVESLEIKHAALAARDAGRWSDAFELLRRCEPYLSAANVAYLRGTIWLVMGDHEAAHDFLDHAARLGAIAPPQAILDRT
ncbi:MAG TPA: hypothetical protein VGX78_17400 [Pirellulales bacterium]|jgi:hypothetical protein|nr:hypothetical protein [Pirellulales bacterium]